MDWMTLYTGLSLFVFGILFWCLSPKCLQCYFVLAIAMLATYTLEKQLYATSLLEIRHPTGHIYDNTKWLLKTSECLRNESKLAVEAVRKAFLQEKHVQVIKEGLAEVAQAFNQLRDGVRDLGDLFRSAAKWLESKGVSCDATADIPYRECKDAIASAREDCVERVRKAGVSGIVGICNVTLIANFVCDFVKPFAKEVCQNMAPVMVHGLDDFKRKIDQQIEEYVKMRVGFHFKVNTSTGVEDKLVGELEKLDTLMHSRMEIFKVMLSTIEHFMSSHWVLVLNLGAPLCYQLCYCCSIGYDNCYIWKRLEKSKKIPAELKIRPLRWDEKSRYYIVPSVMPTWSHFKKIVIHALLSLELWLPLIVVNCDELFTNSLLRAHDRSHKMMDNFDGKLFEVKKPETVMGFSKVVSVVLEFIEQIQEMADFKRFKKCIYEVPPYDYDKNVFVVLFIVRIWISYFRIMLCYVPNWICSHFHEQRARVRYRFLRMKILCERLDENLIDGSVDLESQDSDDENNGNE